MNKLVKLIFSFVIVTVAALLISSCGVIDRLKDSGTPAIPEHNCAQYSVWKIEAYPTEETKGIKIKICDYCEKKLDRVEVSGVSNGLSYEIKDDGAWITGIGDCADTDIVIPEIIEGKNVVGIANGAFYENTNITSVVMPNTVTAVEGFAFNGASALCDVILSSNLKSLGELAFRACALTSVYLPGSLGDQTGYGTFGYCESLKNVVLGEGVKYLVGTFSYCTSLEFLSLPSTLNSIENAFYKAENIKKVNFRGDIGQYCELEKSGNYFGGSQSYATFYNATILIGGNPIPENLVIPEGTTKISYRAFWCMKIKSVKIPDSVTSIGNEAFAHCALLKSVDFGNGLEYIGHYAFRGCESLKEIKIPDGIKTIERGAFQECKGVEYVEIGEGLETLKESTLGCLTSIKTLKLPSTLVRYENPVFLFSTNLESVYYNGTVEEWVAFLRRGDTYHTDDFKGARIYCTDGEIFRSVVTYYK